MKHTKSYVVLALIALITFSCTRDEIGVVEESNDSKILEFDSKEALEQEIDRVLELRKQKEALIINNMFGGNGIPALTDEIIEKGTSTQINKKSLFEAVNFYHTEKLRTIYEEREERNFTSIQSIADEINSLKLINPIKSDELIKEHNNLINKNGFLYESILEEGISNMTGVAGKIKVNGNEIDLNPKPSLAKGDSDIFIESGILATSSDNIVTITWSTGMRKNGNVVSAFLNGDIALTQLACYVNVNGQQILYPGTWFFTNPNSAVRFNDPFQIQQCGILSVPFISGVGSFVREQRFIDQICSNSFYTNGASKITGFVAGRFVVGLPTGEFITAENQIGIDL